MLYVTKGRSAVWQCREPRITSASFNFEDRALTKAG